MRVEYRIRFARRYQWLLFITEKDQHHSITLDIGPLLHATTTKFGQATVDARLFIQQIQKSILENIHQKRLEFNVEIQQAEASNDQDL